jgi:N-acetylglucosaminyldiphosphoundecaprenol N-acetyl-beta-D-mannosaminyltransferase
MKIKSTRILGTRVDLVDMDKTLTIIDEFINIKKTHQIVVINVAKIIKALKDNYLKQIIEEADLSGADGTPVVWVSKFFGPKIPGRVNGTDLMEKLVKRSIEKGYRIFFFGAREEVVHKVIKIYKEKYPKLNVAGYRNGYFTKDQELEIAEEIGKSKAHILFVAFGTPKKEKFINKYKNVMNVPVIHGVGGSFDVVAGVTKRAPLWMQEYGLEWLYRVYQEPGRMWKRYLVTNTLFIWYILLHILRLKKFN